MSPRSSRTRAVFRALVSLAALAGCGGAPPAPEASAPAGSPAAAAAAVVTPDVSPTATVLGIGVSDKGDRFTRVTISFKNPAKVSCKIPSYTLSWAGGTKTIPLSDFVLAAGEAQTRATRVHASDGDITSLTTPSETRVELVSECDKR
jgi:hypothetical protein